MKTLEDIEIELKNSLILPSVKNNTQFFLCPVGLNGSGKTTVIKVLTEKLHLLRLSTDELRRILKQNSLDFKHTKEISLKIASEFALKGYSIAFDMNCGTKETKDFLEYLANKIGAKIIWININTPEEYIIEGLKNHHHLRSWLIEDLQKMIDNYYSQKEKRLKENLKFDFLYTFDNSRPDIKKQIDECEKKIMSLLF